MNSARYEEALERLAKRTPIHDHQKADGHYRVAESTAQEHVDENPQPDLR